MWARCVLLQFPLPAKRLEWNMAQTSFAHGRTHFSAFPSQVGAALYLSICQSESAFGDFLGLSWTYTIRFFSELKVSSQNWPFCFCVLGLGDCQMHSLLNCHSASASSEKIWLVAENVESYLTAAKNFWLKAAKWFGRYLSTCFFSFVPVFSTDTYKTNVN